MNLYILPISNINENLISKIKLTFPQRYSKAEKFKMNNDFLRSVGSTYLMYKLLDIKEEKEISYSPFGKPYILGKEKFNISHSGEYVCLVKDESEVGVDIQEKDEKKLTIAGKIYNSEEIHWMKNDQLNNFFILWSIKESIIKLLGNGFVYPLTNLDVTNALKDKPIIFGEKTIYTKFLIYENYSIAISSYNPIDSINIVNL